MYRIGRCKLITITKVKDEIKVIPLQAWTNPWGSRSLRLLGFLESRHMNVVVLSVLFAGRLYSQEIFLVLVSFRGWVDPRATVRPEGLCQWKIPMTGNGTRDLPVCRAVPQPTVPPSAPTINGGLTNPNTTAAVHVLPNLRTTEHPKPSLFCKDPNSKHSLVWVRSFHNNTK